MYLTAEVTFISQTKFLWFKNLHFYFIDNIVSVFID